MTVFFVIKNPIINKGVNSVKASFCIIRMTKFHCTHTKSRIGDRDGRIMRHGKKK